MVPVEASPDVLFRRPGRCRIDEMAEGLPVLCSEAPDPAPGFEPLDGGRIGAALSSRTRAWHRRLDCYAEVDSTNQVLLDRSREEPIDGHLCLAEHQSAGRGRQGRSWFMPWGAGLCLSLGFRPGPILPGCLGIAAGIGVVRAIRQSGLSTAGLKWPNDILFERKKLGGVLVETRTTPRGATGTAVIGIGLNVAWPPGLGWDLGQPHTDLRAALGREISRNSLAASVIDSVCEVLHTVRDHGFEALRAEWTAYDLVVGRLIEVRSTEGVFTGEARRLDPDGALVVAVEGRLLRLYSEEVSVRPAP
jgi:BirA family biotin operon repressor/biotin-[acetyl-CoA-carboxylase] ligase